VFLSTFERKQPDVNIRKTIGKCEETSSYEKIPAGKPWTLGRHLRLSVRQQENFVWPGWVGGITMRQRALRSVRWLEVKLTVVGSKSTRHSRLRVGYRISLRSDEVARLLAKRAAREVQASSVGGYGE